MQIDSLIKDALFSDSKKQATASENIYTLASENSIRPMSLFTLYKWIGAQQTNTLFTVPAINLRTLTYDSARIIFRLMKKYSIGPVIFEIAKSEMNYTDQNPRQYAVSILAAAISEGHTGPVFIQGDHFQINKDHFADDREKEIESIEKLIKDTVSAKFFNIDIDASTLVDLSKENIQKQQAVNSEITAHFTSFIRNLQPKGMSIAIGGEIGHIGGINSTVHDFSAFMDGYSHQIGNQDGISKVSVQTGSSHGGTPLPDGTVKQITIDFSVLRSIGNLAKSKYGLGGAVQHGASTLPIDLFNQFPQNNTVEIHLATGFQNTVYDHMPQSLRAEMYEFVKNNFKKERKDDMNDEQYLYSLRKKALGPFKKPLFDLRAEEKKPILDALEGQLESIFEKLGVFNTQSLIDTIYKQ